MGLTGPNPPFVVLGTAIRETLTVNRAGGNYRTRDRIATIGISIR